MTDDEYVAKLGKFHQSAADTYDVIMDAARSYHELPIAEAARVYAAKLLRDVTAEGLAAGLAYMSLRHAREPGPS